MSRRLGRVDVVMCVVIGLAAALASLVATRDGVGIDADSAAYLSAAHSVVHGDGVVVPFSLYTDEYSPRDAATRAGHFPLTHFPPLYPLAVAAVSLPGLGVEDAARVLGALLLALNVALLGAVASRCVPNAAVRAAVLILAVAGPVAGEALSVHHRTWLFQHGQAMSEGLFTTFVLLTLLATLRYRRTPTRAALALVAASAGAAFAVRYSGVALVAVAAVAVTMWSSGSRGVRVARGAIVAAAAALPLVLWEVVTIVATHAQSARSLHWPNRGASELPVVFEGWLGVATWPSLARHAALAAVVAIVVIVVQRTREPAFWLIGATVVAYAIVVVATRAVLDASTLTDARIFSPLQGPFYVLVVGAMVTAASRAGARARAPKPALAAVGIGLALLVAVSSLPEAWRLVDDGLAPRAPVSATVVAATALPERALIATNVPTQIWEASRRGSILVPLRARTATDTRNRSFTTEVRQLVDVVCRRRGYVALVSPSVGGFGVAQQANEHDFDGFTELEVFRRLDDGVILRPRPHMTCHAA